MSSTTKDQGIYESWVNEKIDKISRTHESWRSRQIHRDVLAPAVSEESGADIYTTHLNLPRIEMKPLEQGANRLLLGCLEAFVRP